MTAEQIHGLVASLPEEFLCFRNVRSFPWPANGRSRREAQVAYALSEPRIGWIVAKTSADQGQLVPSSVRIPAIRRANYHLLGYPDRAVKEAITLTRPQQRNLEVILKGLVCSRDIDLPGIANYMSIPEDVVRVYGDLFFNVRDRLDDGWYMSGIAYPETRIGQVLEAERDRDDLDLTFIRAGYESGWQAVTKLAGSAPMIDAEDLDVSLAKLEQEIVGNSEMLTWMGHLNREKSPGLGHAQGLLTAAQKESKRDEAADRLPTISVPEAMKESLDRIMRGSEDYELALKAQELAAARAARQAQGS